jgi:hypothetical protein
MPETGRPASGTDTPAIVAISVNVPSPLFRNRKFGTVSFVTNTSRRPSWSKSANATLIPFPGCAAIPERADTSSYVPSPRL